MQCHQLADPKDNAAIRVMKQADGNWTLNGVTCTRPARPQVTAAMVRDRVVRLIPTAAVGLAPHGATLVNIETVMWVDARDQQTLAPVEILGRRVVISLRLDHVQWRFGDGSSDSTNGAGRRYREQSDPCTTRQCPGYFGHTYLQPERVHVNARAWWTARFTVDGGDSVTIPGTVAGPAGQAAIVVKQARGVLVQNPGGH